MTATDIVIANADLAVALAAAGIPPQVAENTADGLQLSVSIEGADRSRAAAIILHLVQGNPQLGSKLKGTLALLMEGAR